MEGACGDEHALAPILLKGDQHPRGDGEIPGRVLVPTCYLKYRQRDCC